LIIPKTGTSSALESRKQSRPSATTATESENSRQQSPVKPPAYNKPTEKANKKNEDSATQKIMITGDDILIEYVSRLMNLFSTNKIREEALSFDQQSKIEKFITHYVWYAQDKNKQEQDKKTGIGSLKLRLDNRLNEMLERRRRLLKMLFKNEGRLSMFHEQYPDIVKRKKEVIEKFDSKELEHLLSNSTKNVA